MPDESIRVMCVDDHPMVLEGLASMIARQPDMRLVAVASSGSQAVTQFRAHRPDVTLMDLQMLGLSGLDAITAIRGRHPAARVIVLTMFEGEEDIRRALRAGAVTYLLKDVRSDEMLRIIRQVHAGERPIPASIASLLSAYEDQALLTEREVQVLQLIAEGLRNKEVGAMLRISEETVKTHVKNILSKFGVNDRMAAVNIGLHRGVIRLRR
jgi:DNA-binding NarL/FixJ family response regulator